jgi:hypothetical protein
MGRVCGASGGPTLRNSVISPAGVEIDAGAAEIPAPDDHFAASPHGCVRVSRGRCASGAGSQPTITGRVISAAGVCIVERLIDPAPDNHFTAGPYCRVNDPAERDVHGAGSYPAVRAGIVLAAGVQIVGLVGSTPDDHFAASPYRCVAPSCGRRVYDGGSYPAVRAGIVAPTAVKTPVSIVVPAPDDHFAAGPYCGGRDSCGGRVGDASSCPTILGWIVRSERVFGVSRPKNASLPAVAGSVAALSTQAMPAQRREAIKARLPRTPR